MPYTATSSGAFGIHRKSGLSPCARTALVLAGAPEFDPNTRIAVVQSACYDLGENRAGVLR